MSLTKAQNLLFSHHKGLQHAVHVASVSQVNQSNASVVVASLEPSLVVPWRYIQDVVEVRRSSDNSSLQNTKSKKQVKDRTDIMICFLSLQFGHTRQQSPRYRLESGSSMPTVSLREYQGHTTSIGYNTKLWSALESDGIFAGYAEPT